MLFALEVTLKPTYLDKLQNPDSNQEEESGDQQNAENRKEPDCAVVMTKCWGELLFIFIYVGVIFALIVTLVYAITLGKLYSCLVEFALCIAFDQIKSIPC
jgi:hypothetical protein